MLETSTPHVSASFAAALSASFATAAASSAIAGPAFSRACTDSASVEGLSAAKGPAAKNAISAGRKPIETLTACTPALSPSPHLTVFDDVGHGSWRRVFESEHYDTNLGADGQRYSNIYQWMLTFNRPVAPGR